MQPSRYTFTQKFLHWLIGLAIIGMIALGLIMTEMPRSPLRGNLYAIHKSIGVIILFFALWRLVVRWRNGAPPQEASIPRWQKWAAHLSHYSLYALIILVPLAGWIGSSASGYPVDIFWLIPATLPIAPDRELAGFVIERHAFLAWTIAVIIGIHIAAALYHHFVRRDNTLKRMLSE